MDRQPKTGNPLFYGWYIVSMAFLANFMSVGTSFYIFNAFMEPLSMQRDWSRTEINVTLIIGTLIGFFGQLLYGTLVMRTGPRLLMTVGGVIAGAAFIALGHMHNLYAFYLTYVILFMGNGALGGIVANTAVNNWFVKKRGKALGLATAGVSLSGAVIPFIALLILERTSLENAFLYIGASLLLTCPLAWITIRNRPEDHGMSPDGMDLPGRRPGEPGPAAAANPGGPVSEATLDPVWTPGMIVRTGAFWKVGLAFGLVMMGVVGVMSQLKPRFSDVGFDDRTAMALMCATALMGAAGKYVWGAFCDRFDPRNVAAVLIAGNAAGLALALAGDSVSVTAAFIALFGFSMGGVMSTFPIIVGHLFGRESFASVLRFLALFLVLQVGGYLMAGLSYDHTGSYNPAYAAFIGLDAAAAALILSVKRP